MIVLPNSKPRYGTPINRRSVIWQGLVYCLPLWEGSGAPWDVVYQLPHTLYSGTTWGNTITPSSSIACTAASRGVYASLPKWLQVTYPYTMAWRGYVSGSPSAGNPIFTMYTNGASSPTGMRWGSSSVLRFSYLNAGTSASWTTTYTIPSTPVTLVIVATSTTISLYVNGQFNQSDTGLSLSNPTWTGTSYISVGANPSSTSAPDEVAEWGMVWNRALSANEIAEHLAGAFPPDLFQAQPQPYWWPVAQPAAAAIPSWILQGDQISDFYG
jgi:hypothetical protein